MIEKPDLDKELKEEMGKRLVAARIAAGFSKRSEVFAAFPLWTKHTYSSHELGRRKITEPFARKYAAAFNVSVSHLLAHDLIVDKAAKPQPNASFPPRWQAFPAETSIPLRGQISAGANGRFILNGQDIARVFCPPGLEGVEGAYAVQIQGSSGEPRFYNGETAWANPHAKIRQGDDVIVQILGDHEEDDVSSYIKRYVSQSRDTLRLYQYNPGVGEEHDLTFPSKKVFSIHKVVFHAML